MEVKEFINQYKNYPILFLGTGFSLRYLKNSLSWENLLKKIARELTENDEYFYNLKSKFTVLKKCNFEKLALDLEIKFNEQLEADRNGKFKDINDQFFLQMENETHNLSRFKLYISKIFEDLTLRENVNEELEVLKKIRKYIGSIITTNYDKLIEQVFEFSPLISNDIILSNPYGSVYKIHGCISKPETIIITEDDYKNFEKKHELIKAQLLSIFVHYPIIFVGYSVGDRNIKELLKIIFGYVDVNSDLAKKIKNNFLLIEYESNNMETIVIEHEVQIDENVTIRINKIKTDNFIEVYNQILNINIPISVMDIRKVQTVIKDISTGGSIKVDISDDIDSLNNNDKILIIGSRKNIKYVYSNANEFINNYFSIIDKNNSEDIAMIDSFQISSTQYFPIYGFGKINNNLSKINKLKSQQTTKLKAIFKDVKDSKKYIVHSSIEDLINDVNIANSRKTNYIIYAVSMGHINLSDFELYIKKQPVKSTDYKKFLCMYDFKKYS